MRPGIAVVASIPFSILDLLIFKAWQIETAARIFSLLKSPIKFDLISYVLLIAFTRPLIPEVAMFSISKNMDELFFSKNGIPRLF